MWVERSQTAQEGMLNTATLQLMSNRCNRKRRKFVVQVLGENVGNINGIHSISLI